MERIDKFEAVIELVDEAEEDDEDDDDEEEDEPVDEETFEVGVRELNWFKLELLLLEDVAKEDGDMAACLRASMGPTTGCLSLDIKL